MRVSKHFSKEELECPCCGEYIPNEELLEVLEDLREHFGPTNINSSTRCIVHNKEVGGAPNSQHKLGYAADVVCKGVLPEEVHKYLIEKYPDSKGIGEYNTFTHVDVRDYKARW